MRRSGAVLAGVLLGVVVLFAVAPPAGATSCGRQPATGFAAAEDGGWWVVVGGYYPRDYAAVDHPYLYRVSPAGERVSRSSPYIHNESTATGDIARGNDGNWYFLTAKRVVVYDADWTPLNRSVEIRTERIDLEVTNAGLEQTDAGTWWLAYNGELRRYTADWNLTATADVSAHAVTAQDGRVWILQGYHRVARVRYADGEITVSPQWSVDREDVRAIDLVRHPNGFWTLLDSNGVAHRYTPYGQYTGESADLPVSAYTECSGIFAGMVYVLLAPIAVGIWVLLPLGVIAFAHPDRWPAIASAVTLGTAGAFAFDGYWFPWPLSAVYWLPDAVISVLLVLAGALVLAQVSDDRWLFGLCALLLSPLALVASGFWTPPVAVGGVVVGLLLVITLLRPQPQLEPDR